MATVNNAGFNVPQVHLMGKPSPLIYEAAGRLLDLAPADLVAVGDSIEHDIGGE